MQLTFKMQIKYLGDGKKNIVISDFIIGDIARYEQP